MSAYFDETYYLGEKLKQLQADPVWSSEWMGKTSQDVLKAFQGSGMTAEQHYLTFGHAEKLNPNPYFNEVEYLESKLASLKENSATSAEWANKGMTDLAKAFSDIGISPAEHYERYGAYETRGDGTLLNPSNAFDANAYFAAKLQQIVTLGGTLDGIPVEQLTVADIVASMKNAGMSPVTHYLNYGSTEAGAQKIPLVQTVPVSQRVPNDPQRDVRGENVPSNYNDASPAPGDATAKPVLKPADVGGKTPASVSPPATFPGDPVPTPADSDYVQPPSGLVDTNARPVVVVPPASSGGKPQYGFVLNDGSVVAPGVNGLPGSTVIGRVDGSGNIVPSPDSGQPDQPVNPDGDTGVAASYSDSSHILMLTGTALADSAVTVDAQGKMLVTGGTGPADTAVFAAAGVINAKAVTPGNAVAFGIDTSAFDGAHSVLGSTGTSNIATLGEGITSFIGGAKADNITIMGNRAVMQTISVAGGEGSDTLSFNGAAKDVLLTLSSVETLDLSGAGEQKVTLQSVDGLATIKMGIGDDIVLSNSLASELNNAQASLSGSGELSVILTGTVLQPGVLLNLSKLNVSNYTGNINIISGVGADSIILSKATNTVEVNFNTQSLASTSGPGSYDTVYGFTAGRDSVHLKDSNDSPVTLKLAGALGGGINLSNGIVTAWGSGVSSLGEKINALLSAANSGQMAGFADGSDFFLVVSDGAPGRTNGDTVVKLAGVGDAIHGLGVDAAGMVSFA